MFYAQSCVVFSLPRQAAAAAPPPPPHLLRGELTGGKRQTTNWPLNEAPRGSGRLRAGTCEDPVLLARLAPADLERRVQDLGEAQVTHGARRCRQRPEQASDASHRELASSPARPQASRTDSCLHSKRVYAKAP